MRERRTPRVETVYTDYSGDIALGISLILFTAAFALPLAAQARSVRSERRAERDQPSAHQCSQSDEVRLVPCSPAVQGCGNLREGEELVATTRSDSLLSTTSMSESGDSRYDPDQ